MSASVRNGTAGRSGIARALAAAGRWGAAYATWRCRKRAIRELSALDDRTLKDFGINRAEIEAAVYGRRRRSQWC